MPKHHLLFLITGIILIGCTKPSPPPTIPAVPASTLIDCNDSPPHPNHLSILPDFAPSHACELENVSNQVDFCMVHASPQLSYPCSQTESVTETMVGDGERMITIQRDHHYSRGCWTAVSTDTRSLRVCEKENGNATTVARDVKGELVPSPDGKLIAFVDAAPGSLGLEPHIFVVNMDGSGLTQLDKRPFPQNQVVGAQILAWSDDGNWLYVSLWDGSANGHHAYRLRLNGSGEFEQMP